MLNFENVIDIRTRQQPAPTVAQYRGRYIIIGTDYGHVRTIGGDVRTWASYSGARRYLLKRSAP